MNKNQSVGILIVIGIFVLALVSSFISGPTTSTKTLSYTEFLNKVKNQEIKEVVMDSDTINAVPVNDEIIAKDSSGKEIGKAYLRYKVNIPSNDYNVYKALEENNALYTL